MPLTPNTAKIRKLEKQLKMEEDLLELADGPAAYYSLAKICMDITKAYLGGVQMSALEPGEEYGPEIFRYHNQAIEHLTTAIKFAKEADDIENPLYFVTRALLHAKNGNKQAALEDAITAQRNVGDEDGSTKYHIEDTIKKIEELLGGKLAEVMLNQDAEDDKQEETRPFSP